MIEDNNSGFSENDNRNHHNRPKKGKDEIAVGIAVTIGFGAAYFITHIWFLIFPLVFAGLIPLFTGILKAFRRKKLPSQGTKKTVSIDREKEILKVAQELHGRLTVLQVASRTDLSIEDARTTLDAMVKKGYIQLNVGKNGILRYEFPEFFPETDKDDLSKQIENLDE